MTKAEKIREQIESGQLDCMETYLSLKAKIKPIEDILNAIDDLVQIEVKDIQPNKEIEFGNYKVKVAAPRKIFKFDHIEEIVSLEVKVKTLKEKWKNNYEDSMKGIYKGDIDMLPRISYSKRTITVL